MIIRTIQGEAIDAALTQAMRATLHMLVLDGLITQDQCDEYLNICAAKMVYEAPVWSRIGKWLGVDKDNARVEVFKVASNRPEEE